MRDSATRLAAAGFKLFPVEPNGKRPLITAWNTAATTDLDIVSGWARHFPGCNWGIHTEDFLVLDVDPKNGGVLPPEDTTTDTFTVRTPSGGLHLYYRHPGGTRNSSGKVGQGLDIRSNNGYVVAPGSVINGREYVIIEKSPPAAAPEWLVEAAGRPVNIDQHDAGNFDADQDSAVERAIVVMADHPLAIQGDGGDHKTFAAVCRVRDMGVDAAHAQEALEAWNERCAPPWDPDDLVVKINNAYSYASNAAGNAVALDSDFDTAGVIETASVDNPGSILSGTNDPPERTPPKLLTASGIDVPGLLKTNYLIKGWLPARSNALLFGEWGGGKTFTALHMAAHIAAGAPWFDLRVRQGGVLYVGYEGAQGVSCRVQALRLTYPEFPWDTMPFAWFMLNRPLTKAGKGQELLGEVLTEFKEKYGNTPDLVIIDPLRDALGGSDSDADLTAPYLKYAREMVSRMKCTVLTIHHPGHGDKERGRGDSGIEASMDTVIRLDKDAGILETRKQRDGANMRLGYALVGVDIGTDDDGDLVQSCVIEKLDDNPNDPKLTNVQQSLVETLRDAADEDGYLGIRDIIDALPDKDASSRRVLMRIFVDKGYFTVEGTGWTVTTPETGVDIFT